MNNNKTFVSLVVIIAVIAIGAYFFPTGKTVVERVTEKLGVSAGPETFTHQSFRAGATRGGRVASSSELSSLTMAGGELNEISYYSFAPGVADFTLTLPASSTLGYLVPNSGDTNMIYFQNATGTNGIDLTIAGNTGVILRGAHGTSTILYDGMGGMMLFTRSATTSDIYAEFIPQ